MQPTSPATRERIAGLALKLNLGLCIVVAGGLMRWVAPEPTGPRIVAAFLMLIPVLLPLRGIRRGDRRTYAWGTLCLIPYIVVGITEVIANPGGREWAVGCLLLAFSAFIAFIAYLRVSRPYQAEQP